jgi:tetratricopeptide (TPR) repeat protein
VRQQPFAEGIKYYPKALESNPHEFGTNLNWGIAYIKSRDRPAAIHPLGRGVEAEPTNFQAQELLGVALIGSEDFAAAIAHLEKRPYGILRVWNALPAGACLPRGPMFRPSAGGV